MRYYINPNGDYSENKLREYVKTLSGTVWVRKYNNGNSDDVVRTATEKEQEIIEKVLYSSIYSISHGGETETIKDMAEITAMQFFKMGSEEINTYMTVYCRIPKLIYMVEEDGLINKYGGKYEE